MVKKYNKMLVGMFLFVYITLNSTSWQSGDFFGDWMQWQHCYDSRTFKDMGDHLNDIYLSGFKAKFSKHKDDMADLMPFLGQFCSGLITGDGQLKDESNLDECRTKLMQVYAWLDSNPGDLMAYLKNDPLFNSEAINQVEKNADINVVINKYKSFAKLLFACPDDHLRGEYLFSMAGQLFKWGFSPNHWGEFKSYFEDEAKRPVARFACSIMWNYLVGRGWKDWNYKTIENLKQQTKNGAKIVYIAGGTDILKLLENDLYTADIVDPFLPSQGKYYSDPYWERWIRGGDGKNWGKGDKVIFNFHGKKIEMVRSNFRKIGEFEAKLSTGKTVKLEKSITEWNVFGADKRVILGKIIFNRRFAEQKDFVSNKKRAVLMSFNEMYYAFQPFANGGWGMDLSKIPSNFKIHVKQLAFPIDRGYLNSINESEALKFDFIKLGSCAT